MMHQKPTELDAWCALLAQQQVRTYLEIGNAEGDTLAYVTRVLMPDARVYGLDVNPVKPITPAHPGQVITLWTGDSHDTTWLRHVMGALNGQPLDALFIDGDHHGAQQDHELYGPLVRPGGLIGFHDIVPGDPGLVGNVPQYWATLKATTTYRYEEHVASWQQGGWGIGVLFT